MRVYPRFFYDDASQTSSGGAGADATNPPPSTPDPFISAEEAKSFGFDSKEALTAFLREQKKSPETDEEKHKQQNIDTARFLSYSAEANLMGVDEYNKYEELKAKSDADLVFEKYAAESKEDDPEATEKDIRENFEREYRIASTNEKAKARWAAKLKKEADEIRSPYQSKYESARKEFDEFKTTEATFPQYKEFLSDVVKGIATDKVVVTKYKAKIKEEDAEEEVPIEIELSEQDRQDIIKSFLNPKTFRDYRASNGKLDDLKAAIAKKIDGVIRAKKREDIEKKTFEVLTGIGVRKGSAVGATNPYALTTGTKRSPEGRKAADQEVMESDKQLRSKVRR